MLSLILTINNEDDRNFVENIYHQYGKKIYKIAFNILKKETVKNQRNRESQLGIKNYLD